MRIARWSVFACVCVSMGMASCAAEPGSRARLAASPASAAGARLDRELAAIAADPVHAMASLSVLAVKDGKVAYEGAFGRRAIDPLDPALDKPATPDTLYRIASVSKFVTMLGVMRLVEEGRLALERDVSDYLGYPLRNPAYPDSAITLRMLLTHTASLRDDGGYSWGAGVALREALRDNPGAWDRGHPPGAYFTYSNLNWGVIATVMEAATGERFDRLMRRLVLAPLGLSADFDASALAPPQRDKLATLYRKRTPGTGPWVAQVDDTGKAAPASPPGLDQYAIGSNGTVFSPTGGLRASAQDLGKIMLMLLDEGRHEGLPFLAPGTLAQVFSRQWRYSAAPPNGATHHGLFTEWGLGTQRFSGTPGARDSLVAGGGYPAWGHLGEAYGLFSVFAVNIGDRSGVVVLIGGMARGPETTPGTYSALTRQEERVLSAVHELVLRPATN